MNAGSQMVFVVDDDVVTREMVSAVVAPGNRHVAAFGCASEYIAFAKPDVPACLIIDLDLPDINGLDLQARIADTVHPPIVFVTDRGDVSSSVRALKAGAIDVLTKPLDLHELAVAIDAAILHDVSTHAKRVELAALRHRYARLSRREREVLPLVIGGRLNKQAASELGISETTFQIHRRNVMRKMESGSLAELVRMAATLEVPLPRPRPKLPGWTPCHPRAVRELVQTRFA
jgi:FixJ family two-component response regulator